MAASHSGSIANASRHSVCAATGSCFHWYIARALLTKGSTLIGGFLEGMRVSTGCPEELMAKIIASLLVFLEFAGLFEFLDSIGEALKIQQKFAANMESIVRLAQTRRGRLYALVV